MSTAEATASSATAKSATVSAICAKVLSATSAAMMTMHQMKRPVNQGKAGENDARRRSPPASTVRTYAGGEGTADGRGGSASFGTATESKIRFTTALALTPS